MNVDCDDLQTTLQNYGGLESAFLERFLVRDIRICNSGHMCASQVPGGHRRAWVGHQPTQHSPFMIPLHRNCLRSPILKGVRCLLLTIQQHTSWDWVCVFGACTLQAPNLGLGTVYSASPSLSVKSGLSSARCSAILCWEVRKEREPWLS